MDLASPQMKESSVIVRSVYDFTREGRDRIINSYRQQCSYAAAVDCTFDPLHQSFRLKGESRWIEMAFLDFMRILIKHIQEEKNRSPRPSRLLHRNAFTRLNNPPVAWNDDPEIHGGRQLPPEFKNITFLSPKEDQALMRPSDIETSIFPVTRFWTPKVSVEDFSRLLDLNSQPSKPELLSIEDECEVVPDWVKRRVRIGAHDPELVEEIIRKLDKVERIFKSGFKPHSSFLVNVEDVARFQYKLVPLSKQTDRADRTIFEYDSKLATHPVERMHTVRLMEWKPGPQKYVNCKVDYVEIPNPGWTELNDWSGYLYVRHDQTWAPGTPGNTSQALVPLEKLYPEREIEAEDMITQYYASGSELGTLGAAIQGAITDAPPVALTQTPRAIAARRPKIRNGGTAESDSTDLTRVTESDVGDEQPEGQAEGYRLPGFLLDLGARPSDVEEEPVEPALTIRKPRERKRVGLITDGSTNTGTPASPPARQIENFAPRSTTSPESGHSGENLISTRKNRLPRNSASHTLLSDSDSLSSGPAGGVNVNLGARPSTHDYSESDEIRTTRKPKARRKKVIDDSESDNVENLSGLSLGEVGNRKMMNTMRQKSSRGLQKDSEKLRRQNHLNINNDFSKTLEYVRSWSGVVNLEVKLGRLLFLDMGRDATREPIEFGIWDKFVRHEIQDKVGCAHFTPVLTREPNDIQFILGLNVAGGTEPLFSVGRPPKKTVTYEFHCVDADEPCVMVIDGRTFEPVVYSETQAFGNTYISNPKHTWDSCIQLSGRRILPISESLRAIVRSLAAKGQNTPLLTFFITAQNLVVKKVLCKRETRYAFGAASVTKGGPMELVVTEVQHLRLAERKVDGHSQYRALGHALELMKEVGQMWYTVSVASVEASKTLAANQSLGVGEDADWTTESFIGRGKNSIFVGLATAANEVLRNIDNVGFQNVRVL